jgi:hypothetical protein
LASFRSVRIYFRRDQNNKVVSVEDGKREHGEILSDVEQKYLLDLNSGHDIKIDYQGWMLEVATPEQEKLEREKIF